MESLTDKQLIALYLEGNIKAFEGIVNRYSQVLYRYVFHILGNEHEASDVVQETFIKIWKHINKFDISKNFKTWIFTITQRTTIDFLRKRKNISFSSIELDNNISIEENIPDEELLPNEIFEKIEGVVLVQESLKKLSIESRIILILHHGENMTFEEISKIVGKPMNTVKSQYRRSLILLKKILAPKLHPNSY